MKKVLVLVLLIFSSSLFAQKEINTNRKGYAADGYDVVAYFDGQAAEGVKKYSAEVFGVKYKFVSEKNLKRFLKNPSSFSPQYGGWCAYAVGKKNEKVDINPKTYEIRDGKLYLFYNAWGINTLKLWNDEGAEELKNKADANWEKQ